ncbi:cytochrome P450 [Microbacterium sp.]|uniref:cytochrome P450 n=1 Tax=Microbacterium sp. TaxID=51671 RepID=UPI0039E57C20
MTTTPTEVFAAFPFERGADPVLPPVEYAQARQLDAPLVKIKMWNDNVAWLATRYDDVVELLTDNRFSANPHAEKYPSPTSSRAAVLNAEPPALGQIDMPEHSRLRRMFTPMFTLKRMLEFSDQIQEVIDRALDNLVAAGPGADLCRLFAYEIPTTVVAVVMGVPAEDRLFFIETANARFFHTKDPQAAIDAGVALGDYFDRLLSEREASPREGNDVVNRIVNEQILPGNLDHKDAITLLRNILVNGQDTTANVMSIGVVLFLEHPDQLQKVKDDWSKLPGAVAEILRYTTPAHFQAPRTALEEVDFKGITIAKGEGIIASLLAADNDPAEFPDPQAFDVERDTSHHVAFGSGIHTCLGQQLAKVELELAFRTLFTRLPNLKLAVPYEELRFTNNTGQAFGIHEVPVTW